MGVRLPLWTPAYIGRFETLFLCGKVQEVQITFHSSAPPTSKIVMEHGEMETHWVLIPAFVGSSPTASAKRFS